MGNPKQYNEKTSLQQFKERKAQQEMANNLNPRQEIYEAEKAIRRALEEKLRNGEITSSDAKRIWEDRNSMGLAEAVAKGGRDRYIAMDIAKISKMSNGGLGQMMAMLGNDFEVFIDDAVMGSKKAAPAGKQELEEARGIIKEQNDILERLKKDALILHTIDRISKDKKYTFVAKNGVEMRIEAPEGLERGMEVLLHPKSMQIVENLGFPPLEASRFSPSKIPGVTWDDIGGLETAKADMMEAIELPHKHKELFAHYKKRPLKGILLSGAPGCGKTMLGKAAANALARIHGGESARTGFLYVKAPEVLNQYVGQTEQTIRDMFMDANRHHAEHGYPAIIFIDEADAILATRGSRNIGIGNTIVPAFLTEMDGLEASTAIVILATNRPDILDPAIVREGRIDRKIHVDRPDQRNAENIVKINLRNFPISPEYEMDDLAAGMAAEIYNAERYIKDDRRLCDIVSGALIASCVDLAVSSAIHRDILIGDKGGITPDDVLYAVDRIQQQNRGVNHDFD